jgi:hypothetical protein
MPPENGTCGELSSVCSVLSIKQVPTDETGETYRAEIEPNSGHCLSAAIVEAVAAITQTDPLELDPLGEQLDPESLDDLFTSQSQSEYNDLSVSFSYSGYHIVVSDTTHITITKLT